MNKSPQVRKNIMNRHVLEFADKQLDKLDRGPGKYFDLEFWASLAETHPLAKPEPDCGFAGCFIGWAAHQQWFNQFGLVLELVPTQGRGFENHTFITPI